MDKAAKIGEFFQEERKFLNRHVDLNKILEKEGWKKMPSRFNGINQYQRKGTVIHVEYHSGSDSYLWTDHDMKRSGSSLDILKNERESDLKKRFIDALDKLKGYAQQLIPDKLETFYSKHAEVRGWLTTPINARSKPVDPYLKGEREFLLTEVSIYKAAVEFGYKASPETKSGKTYFVKGDTAASFKKSEETGTYLWFDHKAGKGGTIVEFIAAELSTTKEKAYEKVKELAMRLVSAEKLSEFLVNSYKVDANESREGSLRGMIETSQVQGPDARIGDTNKQYTEEFRDSYSVMSIFRQWDTREVVHEVIPRHYRIPEMNTSFERIAEQIGNEEARSLARHALISLANQKVPSHLLQEAMSSDLLNVQSKEVIAKILGNETSTSQTTDREVSQIINQFNLRPAVTSDFSSERNPSKVEQRI